MKTLKLTSTKFQRTRLVAAVFTLCGCAAFSLTVCGFKWQWLLLNKAGRFLRDVNLIAAHPMLLITLPFAAWALLEIYAAINRMGSGWR